MRRALAVGLILFVLTACGNDDGRVITGTVVEVDSQGLTEVSSFEVRADDASYTILIDDGTELDFPPAHLNEHRISGEPVRVEVEERDGDLVARTIGDG